MSIINVSSPIFDTVYPIQAWEDNNRTLKLVQGEGVIIPDNATASTTIQASRAKAPRFQLKSKQGAIDLSSGSPNITWAVRRPNNGGEDLLTCNIVSDKAAEGIIEIPITTSVTEFAGDAYGEIRVTTPNTVIKFFGINACIGNGVSDDAASRSSRYEALLDALQQVVALKNNSGGITINIPEGEEIPENIVVSLIAQMATLDNSGNLKTGSSGSDPISSDTLNTYLQNKYIDYLQGKFSSFQYAHDVHSSSYTEENPIDTYDDGGVYIDDAIDRKKIYLIKNSSNTEYAIMLCATVPEALYAYGATQVRMTYSGGISYRVSTISNGVHSWNSWINIESKYNMDTASSTTSEISDNDSRYPSSKLVRAKLADKVDKKTTIAGLDLSNNITAESLITNLLATGKSINYVYKSSSFDPLVTYGITHNFPIPTLLNVNGKLYLLLSKQQTGNTYKYDGCIIPQYSYIDQYSQFDTSSTVGETGQIVVHGKTVWICIGGTQWVCLNKPIVWDAATSASNNYWVPYDYKGDLGDRIQIVNADGEPELWELQRIWEDEKNGTRYTWAPVTNLHYVEDAIGATEVRMRQITTSFEVTLDKTKWVSHAQTFRVPDSFILDGEFITDITVSQTAFTQLQNDGCTGLFTTYEINNNTLYVTVTCAGRDPVSQDVAIRITIIHITNMDEDTSGGES